MPCGETLEDHGCSAWSEDSSRDAEQLPPVPARSWQGTGQALHSSAQWEGEGHKRMGLAIGKPFPEMTGEWWQRLPPSLRSLV